MTTLITSSATLLDFEWLKFITPSLSILESILCLFVQTSIGTHSGTFICRAKFVCLSGSFLVTKPQKRKAERLHKKNLAFLLRLGQGCCRNMEPQGPYPRFTTWGKEMQFFPVWLVSNRWLCYEKSRTNGFVLVSSVSLTRIHEHKSQERASSWIASPMLIIHVIPHSISGFSI